MRSYVCVCMITALLALSAPSWAQCPSIALTAPFSESGTTCEQGNNCDILPAEDVIFEITIPYASFWELRLRDGSGNGYFYGTTLYGTTCCGQELSQSFWQFTCTWLEPGVIYVTLDGYSQNECHDYTFTVEECFPCEITCPEGAGTSADSICGWSYDQPDTVNGGWAYQQNVCHFYYDELGCDTVLCAFTGVIETPVGPLSERDFYHIVITESNPFFSMWAVGTSGLEVSMWSVFGDPCSFGYDLVFDEVYAADCDTLRAEVCLDPGNYYLEIEGRAAAIGYVPCNSPYVLGVECLSECPPCPCVPGEDTWCFYAEDLDDDGEIDSEENEFEFEIPVEYIITDVNFCIDAEDFDELDEVEIDLISPNGTWIELFDYDELDGDRLSCTYFDDEAGLSINSGGNPYTGTFRPDDPLSGFDGENAQGEWVLYVYDGDYDEAIINHICITFEYDRILPVELNAFEAIPGDGKVTLNWSTASELNNELFEVERDGNLMARLDGAGTSAASHSYSWTDTDLTNGRRYSYVLYTVSTGGAREQVSTTSATPQVGAGTVTEYALHQNYPNPFNPSTTIRFDLVEQHHVSLTVYNALGQTVSTLVNASMPAGRHAVDFDAASLASGLYFYRIEAGDFTALRKMILMK